MRLPALVGLLLLPLAAAAQPRPRVAVLDLVPNGASRELASAATTSVAAALDRLAVFQVITAEAIRSALSFEKQRQMLGCTDAGCMAELGGALGADYLVAGKVTRLPGSSDLPPTVTLDLTLLSARGERVGAAMETTASDAELVTRIPRAVARLAARVLAGRAGRLVVSCSEAGAIVKLDEVVVGTTPLRAALSLPSGPHLLVVEKKGFVTLVKDVRVEPAQLVEEHASLIPSPDFVKDYEARQGKLRTGAWIATGVAAAGAVAAIAFQLHANSLYGSESSPGTFLYDRRRIQDGITVENGKDLRAEASSLKSRLQTSQTLCWVSAGVAGVSAATAAWLWIAGDDPHRYAPYREPERARLSLAPAPGGAVAAVRFEF